ncbi:hypothetical protein MO867_02055 [Microbulbifer sp. OS29]|uniref:Uncharacterized protein n=1 Tax=Microbulbifer okhotskensis TaxID=2926617 RepID=A0A9X2EK35_9GAMM|nr:hypothetical protein [Microbulbifer okhotskensis]MCO1333114.1 hypothetical protein [Microbulbifer okhotskensis]
MNSIGLIYREIPVLDVPAEIDVLSINDIYKTVRQNIKTQFSGWKLKANNLNGEGARSFNRKLGRFKSDWLDFEIIDFNVQSDFYPSDDDIDELRLLQDTEIADSSEWRQSIKEQVAQEKTYLLVGMTSLVEQSQFRASMLSAGLPSDCWPCKFQIFEFVVTNAPLCQFIRYRPHVIV